MRGVREDVKPSGDGCVECLRDGTWWFHLRRCAECGHIGCCDSSPHRHATAHYHSTGHPIIQTFEPGEDWFWDFRDQVVVHGPQLAPPASHPVNQPAPGPEGKVPKNWQLQLNT